MLLGRDNAPAQALGLLANELSSLSHEVFLYSKEGVDEYCQLRLDPLYVADILLLGMSSSEKLAAEEIRVAEKAIVAGIPFGFYADTFRCHHRPWFTHLLDKASFLFVINENEAKSAREMFPNAKVVVSGNPMWEDFFTPKLSREEVRQKLGISDSEKMILCPGGKNLAVNMLHWGGVIEALSQVFSPQTYKVFLSVHPGDRPVEEIKKIQKLIAEEPNVNLDKEVADELAGLLVKIAESSYLAHYNDLVRYSKRVSVKVVPKDLMSTSEMLPGADLVIESASTLGIEAACQRKPIISYFSETALARIEEGSGSRDWDLCEWGVSRRVCGNPKELLDAIQDLLFAGLDVSGMKSRQEEIYPAPPEKGTAVRMMAETLLELARK